MKVHLVKKLTLQEFAYRHPGSRASLDDWMDKLKFADWEQPGDMKQTFNTVDFLGAGSNRVVFDIAGNNYRMICNYLFGAKQTHLFICWIGTHAGYDKIAKTVTNTPLINIKMETKILKYTTIKNKDQYFQYCDQLKQLLMQENNEALQDETDLLTLLIEKYDEEQYTSTENDPITLLRSFMTDHHLTPQNMTELLGISKGYVSDILNYKKGLSKEVIRKLAGHFKVRQEAFNRPYKLISAVNSHLRNASVMNTVKQIM